MENLNWTSVDALIKQWFTNLSTTCQNDLPKITQTSRSLNRTNSRTRRLFSEQTIRQIPWKQLETYDYLSAFTSAAESFRTSLIKSQSSRENSTRVKQANRAANGRWSCLNNLYRVSRYLHRQWDTVARCGEGSTTNSYLTSFHRGKSIITG